VEVKQLLIKKEKDIWERRNETFDDFLSNKLVVPTVKYTHLIDLDKIVYLRADSNYTKIIYDCGKFLIVSKTLKYFENFLLDKTFLRIHSGFLINLKKIIGIKRGGDLKVVLNCGTELPISRRYREMIFSHLFKNK